MNDPEVSPNCTGFCTQDGKARGHPALDDTARHEMEGVLDHVGIPYQDGISDEDILRATHGLYRCGYGYHQIADLAKRGHEEIYDLLTRPL